MHPESKIDYYVSTFCANSSWHIVCNEMHDVCRLQLQVPAHSQNVSRLRETKSAATQALASAQTSWKTATGLDDVGKKRKALKGLRCDQKINEVEQRKTAQAHRIRSEDMRLQNSRSDGTDGSWMRPHTAAQPHRRKRKHKSNSGRFGQTVGKSVCRGSCLPQRWGLSRSGLRFVDGVPSGGAPCRPKRGGR